MSYTTWWDTISVEVWGRLVRSSMDGSFHVGGLDHSVRGVRVACVRFRSPKRTWDTHASEVAARETGRAFVSRSLACILDRLGAIRCIRGA